MVVQRWFVREQLLLLLYTNNTYIMTNFNERTNTLLYKNISLTLYSRKGWCWLCVRGELETGKDCYILTQVALLPHLGWGCSIVDNWGPQALSLQADSNASILSPNCLQLQLELTEAVCGTWLYNCLIPTCFHCSSTYLLRCISWLMVRSRVNI